MINKSSSVTLQVDPFDEGDDSVEDDEEEITDEEEVQEPEEVPAESEAEVNCILLHNTKLC